MATTTVVPLSEYLRTSYRPDCDWINGELRARNVGERPHAMIQKFFTMFLGSQEKAWGVQVLPEQRVQTSADHYRIPDLCVVRVSDPFEAIVRVAPLLCIEILSYDDRMTEMQERIDDYLHMGVETVWVVDPRRRKAFQTDGLSLQPVDELTVPGTAIRVEVSGVFAELNELEGKSKS
jgi:Uma2 family endonuclease